MSALGNTWRFHVKNATGGVSSATASTIKGKRWKPGSAGEADYEASEQTLFSNGSIASGGYANGSANDNDVSGAGYYGLAGLITIVNGSSAGYYEIYIQQSSDGGTTWPDNGQGELVAVVYAAASATVKASLNL